MANESTRTLLSLVNTAINEPTLVNLSVLYDFGVEYELQDQVDQFLKTTPFPFLVIHQAYESPRPTFSVTFDADCYVHEYRTKSLHYAWDKTAIIVCWLYCDLVSDEVNEINTNTLCNKFRLEMYREWLIDNEVFDSASYVDRIDALTYVRLLAFSKNELEAFLVPYIDRLLKIPFCQGSRHEILRRS